MLNAVVLAAGMGTRLGRLGPKPLTRLVDGRTIIEQQIENLQEVFMGRLRLTVVVGFQFPKIVEHVPQANFIYNPQYATSNTSKSLLLALRSSPEGGVLWLNGDLVFDREIVPIIDRYVRKDISFVAVNRAETGDEEMKYSIGIDGNIAQLSKTLSPGAGEAVGINYVSASDKDYLIKRLERVGDGEYFEAGMSAAVLKDNVKFWALDISPYYAVEVDFNTDLARANSFIVAP